jgi:prepilin-type N-terminal cleavage/methylation domain-containing protein
MRYFGKRIKSDDAFSLVEMMVVVLVIALLATIAIPNLLRARVNAHDASAKAALKSIATALETYATANSEYPPDTTSLLAVTPPYLHIDYFTGQYNGFTFTSSITPTTYTVVASPASTGLGSGSFTITTGGVLIEN